VLYPDEKELVFISGGIGITPLISMLRHMRDTKADIDVRMLCFNRTERDIAFRDELAEIESGEFPRLNVNHILSTPSSSWQRGQEYPNKDMIGRLLGDDVASKVYYVCGPPPMMKIVINALRDLGVSGSNIRYENFAL
jgi:ferredoxin-NADP reductase